MKNIRFVAVLFAFFFAVALSASAATLVVLNKSEHTASLIDPDSGKTLAKLPVGRGPHEVIVSPDGRTAYVSNFGPYGICPAGRHDVQDARQHDHRARPCGAQGQGDIRLRHQQRAARLR